ncbi:MAG: hypothetical protein ABIJ37_03235 [Pseudomonadota bacterium]
MNIKDKRHLLIEKEITITELSIRIGRSRTWTSQTYYGRKHPRPTQEAIARELGVPIDKLFSPKKAA